MEAAEERGLASDSLEAFLLEFDHAVRDFEQRGSSRPEAPLQTLKTGLQRSLCGSDCDGSGTGKSISPSSSLNSSQEDLMAGVASSQIPCSTAKLGDTRELEAFIADLDQILKGRCGIWAL
ncbi:regulator of cell cycle RGCC-like isoform X2 [Ahaetulla prasina]|uniref:regulator of cell cycle RGCC-like isoform X2 n=1 Tax=Ahaetulla prasina TaxID=499056 RepID=UPI002648585B|nr:regulator of cell cycle RGCC-like isoform X2 [Ahaetulla prasina]